MADNDKKYIKDEIEKIKPNIIILKDASSEIKNDKNIIDKVIDFNVLYGINSFSDLMKNIRRGGNDGISAVQDDQLSWRSVDPRSMWSPVDFGGQVYEWNRGVIGISQDGKVLKEKLDGTFNHHAEATVRISGLFGENISTSLPFEAGVKATERGIIIIQTEGRSALLYLPDELSSLQFERLRECISPRIGFRFSIAYNGRVVDDLDYASVLSFTTSITTDELIEVSGRTK